MTIIYHITTRDEWQGAQADGAYRAPSLESEGFIHCSTAKQVIAVANAFYSGQTDLVLLAIETERLTAETRWEAPVHPNPDNPAPVDEADLFPHIYGAISVDAVTQVHAFPAHADGTFTLPVGVE